MFKYGNIKFFIIKICFGLLFLTTSVFLFLSLISYSSVDPTYGNSVDSEKIFNLGGMLGANISGIFYAFFSLGSFLVPFFLLISGTKLILGINNRFLILKFILIFASILTLAICLSMIGTKNILGDFLTNFLQKYFILLNNDILYWCIFGSFLVISFLLACISFGLSFKKNLKVFSTTFKIFFNIIKYILSIFFSKRFSNIKANKVAKKRITKKTEPTILKSKKNILNIKNNKEYKQSELHYILPSTKLLKTSNLKSKSSKELEKRNIIFSQKLEKILSEYGVEGKVVNFKYGPVVTLYEFLPAAGIKTSKVVGLSDDIARAMSSFSTRISSQPGKTSIGIEIPNEKREDVLLGDLIKEDSFTVNQGSLMLALGKNISGEKKFADLEKMPHLLIAGTTGSGKSVGINSMIISLLLKFTPSECKLILIDPKMLELSIYEDIPHLLTPVVTNPNKAVFALKWVVREMENRYRLMSSLNVKNNKSFNSKISSAISSGRKLYREVQTGIDKDSRMPIIEKKEILLEKMPLIVVVIDEMADLMMVAGKEVESLVQRLAQMARASGIHLIAATQRPSVDVITGTIKANFPSRISFRVASRFDSRTILNEMGAEQLLGSGDMLFLENGANLTRLHGGFVSENEIESIVDHIKSQSSYEPPKDITLEKNIEDNSMDLGFDSKDVDELYDKALDIILNQQKVSTSYIQRYLQIGYNRAARIVEKMEEDGYISEAGHSGKRSVLKKNK
mgnify:CR=1 FL=1